LLLRLKVSYCGSMSAPTSCATPLIPARSESEW
jgi:hypothetical protein